MKKICSKIVLGFMASALLMTSAFAASSPIPQLQSTANTIIAQLQANKASLKNNPNIAYNIVTQYLVPMVNQQYMAQAVLGRNAWNNATAAQRSAFIAQFKILVVRTYAAAFSQFTDEQVKFMPIRGNIDGQSMLQVQSQIVSSSRPPINVNYNLMLSGSSWKIIDFSVDGISMIQSFSSQFAGVLAQSGMNGLIQTLTAHNQKNS